MVDSRTAEELYKMSREHLGVLGTKEVQKKQKQYKKQKQNEKLTTIHVGLWKEHRS